MEGGMIMAWLGARLIPIGAGVAAVMALLAWDYVRIEKAETRGATEHAANVERNNGTVKQIGRQAAGNNGLPVSGSVRDPGYRFE
jgi:hypothetical protein